MPSCRFGPYCCAPVGAGLEQQKDGAWQAFRGGTDSRGAIEKAHDFMLAGTAPESLYGMCESMWRPDMVRACWPGPWHRSCYWCPPCPLCACTRSVHVPLAAPWNCRAVCTSLIPMHALPEGAVLSASIACRSQRTCLKRSHSACCLAWTETPCQAGAPSCTSCEPLADCSQYA